MREILFRGKRTDNGEWVEGYYIHRPSAVGISISNPICIWIPAADPDDSTKIFEVSTETVSQFTGLYDKNGRKIFEGDIVRTKKYGKVIGHTNVNDYDAFQVVYEPAIFRLVNSTRGFNLVGQAIDWEVIGNIYTTRS